MTDERMALYVRILSETGSKALAAKSASVHSVYGCQKSFDDYARRHPEWIQRIADAEQHFNGLLYREAVQRAGLGDARQQDLEPVIQKGTQATLADGTPAFIRRKSDAVLLKLLTARIPEFQDIKKIEHMGEIKHNHRSLSIGADELLFLSREERQQLRGILISLARSRGEPIEVIDRSAPALNYIEAEATELEPEEWESAHVQ